MNYLTIFVLSSIFAKFTVAEDNQYTNEWAVEINENDDINSLQKAAKKYNLFYMGKVTIQNKERRNLNSLFSLI